MTPRVIVEHPEGLIAFLKRVLSAEGEYQSGRPAEMWIGDSIIIVSDGGGLREVASAFLYVYVEDVDATYGKALAQGAISVEAPEQMPYGDRRATVKDLWRNTWQFAAPAQSATG